jgi:hypothetical protein
VITDHHHQITKLSHSINAIGPAPHRAGRKREHRSIMFATITHIPSLHKIRRNAPRYHPTNPLATPNIIRNKTQQLGHEVHEGGSEPTQPAGQRSALLAAANDERTKVTTG